MLENLVDAGEKIVERVLAVGVGQCAPDELAVGIEQVNLHALKGNFGRFIEIAIRIEVGLDESADRPRQQLAEVVIETVVAIVERGAGDFVDAAVGFGIRDAAVVAGGVFAIEPSGGLNFADAVFAGRQDCGIRRSRVLAGSVDVVVVIPVPLPLASRSSSVTPLMACSLV